VTCIETTKSFTHNFLALTTTTILYQGFVRSCNSAFHKINNHDGDITSKPVLVLTSEGDDVLMSSEIETLFQNIQQGRTLKTYRYNAHDVFLSLHDQDNQAAIADVRAFLEDNFY